MVMFPTQSLSLSIKVVLLMKITVITDAHNPVDEATATFLDHFKTKETIFWTVFKLLLLTSTHREMICNTMRISEDDIMTSDKKVRLVQLDPDSQVAVVPDEFFLIPAFICIIGTSSRARNKRKGEASKKSFYVTYFKHDESKYVGLFFKLEKKNFESKGLSLRTFISGGTSVISKLFNSNNKKYSLLVSSSKSVPKRTEEDLVNVSELRPVTLDDDPIERLNIKFNKHFKSSDYKITAFEVLLQLTDNDLKKVCQKFDENYGVLSKTEQFENRLYSASVEFLNEKFQVSTLTCYLIKDMKPTDDYAGQFLVAHYGQDIYFRLNMLNSHCGKPTFDIVYYSKNSV